MIGKPPVRHPSLLSVILAICFSAFLRSGVKEVDSGSNLQWLGYLSMPPWQVVERSFKAVGKHIDAHQISERMGCGTTDAAQDFLQYPHSLRFCDWDFATWPPTFQNWLISPACCLSSPSQWLRKNLGYPISATLDHTAYKNPGSSRMITSLLESTQAYVDAHNNERFHHGAKKIMWNNALSVAAPVLGLQMRLRPFQRLFRGYALFSGIWYTGNNLLECCRKSRREDRTIHYLSNRGIARPVGACLMTEGAVEVTSTGQLNTPRPILNRPCTGPKSSEKQPVI
jgi:hypothetical protein